MKKKHSDFFFLKLLSLFKNNFIDLFYFWLCWVFITLRHYFAIKGPSSQSCGFSSRHVWMWELDCEESWALKNDAFELWCWRRLLRVPWIARKPNQSNQRKSVWIFIGRNDAEAETPICWPSDAKNWHTGKDPDAGKYWGQEEKGVTEDEMIGWHHWLDGHEFEEAPGVGAGPGSLAAVHSVSESWTWLIDWIELIAVMGGFSSQICGNLVPTQWHSTKNLTLC